ncbi:MAG: ATP-binding cassette domain-containing protein [Spirochaetaceae bacterium]|nr:ATP-binding cassette domain-containing protein [Spirochaetaceae bacterium]
MAYIRLEHIGKSFSGREVLRDISLAFNAGEICGIIGENGAGKSTLVHILSGQVMSDAGRIYIEGKEAGFSTGRTFPEEEAIRRGIGIVHQRPLLARELTVGENCLLMELPGIRSSRAEKYRRLNEICRQWDLAISLSQPVSALTAPGRLQAALLAALYRSPKLLILDEPSAALAPDQRSSFFASLRKAASEGLSVILITHNLDETLSVCDRVVVLRKGILAADLENRNGSVSSEELRALMFGESVSPDVPVSTVQGAALNGGFNTPHSGVPKQEGGQPLFSVSGVTVTGPRLAGLYDISFDVYSGKITVIAGHRESGLETLEAVLTGRAAEAGGHRAIFGSVRLNRLQGEHEFSLIGRNRVTPKALRALGTAIVPSDRTFRGSHPALSVYDMLIIYRHRKLCRRGLLSGGLLFGGVLNRKALRAFALSLIKGEGIAAVPEQKSASLSGGMLQRLILARERSSLRELSSLQELGFLQEPGFVILCEPEWGLDVQSSRLLWERIRETAAQGTAVLVLTSEGRNDLPLAEPEGSAGDGTRFADSVYYLESGRMRK